MPGRTGPTLSPRRSASAMRACMARRSLPSIEVVGHALEQGVAELVHGLRPVVPPAQDLRLDQRVERREHGGARQAEQAGERLRREGAAGAGRRLHDAARVAQAVEAFRQHLGEGERQRRRSPRGGRPGAVLPGALVDERQGELLGEERDAVGGLGGADAAPRPAARGRRAPRAPVPGTPESGKGSRRIGGVGRSSAGVLRGRARGQHDEERPVGEALRPRGRATRPRSGRASARPPPRAASARRPCRVRAASRAGRTASA